jgi:hypothetical protein
VLELVGVSSGILRLSDHAARSWFNRLGFGQGLPAVDRRMTIRPETSKARNSIAAISAQDRTVCVSIRRLNSSCSIRWRCSCRLLYPGRRLCATSWWLTSASLLLRSRQSRQRMGEQSRPLARRLILAGRWNLQIQARRSSDSRRRGHHRREPLDHARGSRAGDGMVTLARPPRSGASL